MLFCSVALLLSHQSLTYVAGIIRRDRVAIGSLRPKLNRVGRPCSCRAASAKAVPSRRSPPRRVRDQDCDLLE